MRKAESELPLPALVGRMRKVADCSRVGRMRNPLGSARVGRIRNPLWPALFWGGRGPYSNDVVDQLVNHPIQLNHSFAFARATNVIQV